MDNEPPRPGNHDRAWNDPPLFSYKPDTQVSGSSGLKLNKRVMYPVGQQVPATNPNSTSGIEAPRLHDAGAKRVGDLSMMAPPPPIAKLSAPNSCGDEKMKPSCNVSDEDREKCLSTLTQVTQKFEDRIDSTKMRDIRKRLTVMESKWKEGSLNECIEKGLVLLVEALGESRLDEADRLQKKLMVDWPSQCGTWLVAIKHLIFEAKSAAAVDS